MRAFFEQIERLAFCNTVILRVVRILFIIDFFNGNCAACNPMLGQPNWIARALTNHFLHLVLSEVTLKALHVQDCVLGCRTLFKRFEEERYLVVFWEHQFELEE